MPELVRITDYVVPASYRFPSPPRPAGSSTHPTIVLPLTRAATSSTSSTSNTMYSHNIFGSDPMFLKPLEISNPMFDRPTSRETAMSPPQPLRRRQYQFPQLVQNGDGSWSLPAASQMTVSPRNSVSRCPAMRASADSAAVLNAATCCSAAKAASSTGGKPAACCNGGKAVARASSPHGAKMTVDKKSPLWALRQSIDECDSIVAKQRDAERKEMAVVVRRPVLRRAVAPTTSSTVTTSTQTEKPAIVARPRTPSPPKKASAAPSPSAPAKQQAKPTTFFSPMLSLDMDMVEKDDKYTVVVKTPGITKDNLYLSVHGDGILTLHGKQDQFSETNVAAFRRISRLMGHISRSFKLPEDVNVHDIKADYKTGTDGVDRLLIQLPKIKPNKLQKMKQIVIQ